MSTTVKRIKIIEALNLDLKDSNTEKPTIPRGFATVKKYLYIYRQTCTFV